MQGSTPLLNDDVIKKLDSRNTHSFAQSLSGNFLTTWISFLPDYKPELKTRISAHTSYLYNRKSIKAPDITWQRALKFESSI